MKVHRRQRSTASNSQRAACRTVRNGLAVALLLTLASVASADEPTLSVERTDDGAAVKIDGELFTHYLTRSGSKPVLWPVIGPTGKPVTRSYPVGEVQEHERDDHIHHRSFWFTHGDVNGVDFWLEPRRDREEHGVIDHQEFTELEADGSTAVVATRNHWINGKTGEKVCEDEQRLTFGSDGTNRWVDYMIVIKATDGDVTFGDTKEGTFGVRVAGTMKVEEERGGKIVNSEGAVATDKESEDEVWGKPADWVDYTGPVDGQTVGIAIFSHPENFRHPCRWHVRTYGLFTANPFGKKDFPEVEGHEQGVYTIKDGDSLTLRYGVYFHPGATESADIPTEYQEYLARTQP